MKILFTGGGRSGSWLIRGEQLGAAIGADVVPNGAVDVAGYDVAVVVKRPRGDVVERLHRAKVPLVWDVVDAWPQPEGNGWGFEAARAWLAAQVRAIRPAGIVAATGRMAADCAAFGLPVIAVPHHPRPGAGRTPIRPAVCAVGYEGGLPHLGAWAVWFELECGNRGWRFVRNPATLNELDIVIALREQHGYAALHWKSNVKLANAQATGTPVICGREAGYLETGTGGEQFADTPAEVLAALDALVPAAARAAAAAKLAAGARALPDIAMAYHAWLETHFAGRR